MKICIDARNLIFEAHWAGTTLYTLRMIEALLKIDKTNSYTLYFNFLRGRLLHRLPMLRDMEARMRVLRLPRKYADILCDDYHFPIDLVTGSFDVLHSPAYELPYHRSGISVVTIPDLAFHLYPDWIGEDWRDHFIRDVRSSLERADLFITISHYIKGEMIEHLGIPEEKIIVTHLAVDERFSSGPDEEGRKVLINRYGLMDPYLLSVATQEPKKNLSRLLRAYKILNDNRPDLPRLVLAGKRGWESTPVDSEIKALGLQHKVVTPGYIPSEDIPTLYRHAKIFLFPSVYEGFGMPILEAMASGCPVVAGKTTSIPEVAGGAAALVDPFDVEAIAAAIDDLLSHEEKCENLIRKGREKAREFTWEKTALQTLEAYRLLE